LLESIGFIYTSGTGYEWNWYERGSHDLSLGSKENLEKDSEKEREDMLPSPEIAFNVLQTTLNVLERTKNGDLSWYDEEKREG